jgi:hypothetical protein
VGNPLGLIKVEEGAMWLMSGEQREEMQKARAIAL